MPTYTYPAMPAVARVWYQVGTFPPAQGTHDEAINVSISPIAPSLAVQGPARLYCGLAPTHIIRTAPNAKVCENSHQPTQNDPFPCTVFEVPITTGHWYVCLWYHECGYGFDNWHARIYVARLSDLHLPTYPIYKRWI